MLGWIVVIGLGLAAAGYAYRRHTCSTSAIAAMVADVKSGKLTKADAAQFATALEGHGCASEAAQLRAAIAEHDQAEAQQEAAAKAQHAAECTKAFDALTTKLGGVGVASAKDRANAAIAKKDAAAARALATEVEGNHPMAAQCLRELAQGWPVVAMPAAALTSAAMGVPPSCKAEVAALPDGPAPYRVSDAVFQPPNVRQWVTEGLLGENPDRLKYTADWLDAEATQVTAHGGMPFVVNVFASAAACVRAYGLWVAAGKPKPTTGRLVSSAGRHPHHRPH